MPQTAAITGDRRSLGPTFTRRASWALAAVIFVTYVIALVVPIPASTRTLVLAYLYLLPPALAVAGASFVLGLTTDHSDRTFWALVLAASLAFLIGEAYVSWYGTVVQPGGPTPPSITDGLYVLGYAALVGAVLTMVAERHMPRAERLTRLLDLGAVVAAAFALFYGFAVAPSPAGAPVTTALTVLIYPLLDVTLIGAATLVLLGFKRTRWFPWESLMVAGVGFFLIGDVGLLATLEPISQNVVLTGLFELSWIAGYLLFFVAAAYRLSVANSPLPTLAHTTMSADRTWRDLVVPGVMLVVVPVLLVAAHAASGPATLGILLAAGGLLGAAIGARLITSRALVREASANAVTDALTGSPTSGTSPRSCRRLWTRPLRAR